MHKKARAFRAVCIGAVAATVFIVGDPFLQEQWDWYDNSVHTRDVRFQGVACAFGTAITALVAGSLAEENAMTAKRVDSSDLLDK